MERHCKDYRKWEQSPPRIREGTFRLVCINAEKQNPNFNGKEHPIVVLFHRVITDDGEGPVIIQRLPIYKKFSDGTRYYKAWVTATGHRPDKPRMKEMPMRVFIGKSFYGKVEDHIPFQNDHDSRLVYAMEGITDPPCHCGHFEHEHTRPKDACSVKPFKRKAVKSSCSS